MLLYQSYKCGTVDYESLGYAIGGPFWKVRMNCVHFLRGTWVHLDLATAVLDMMER